MTPHRGTIRVDGRDITALPPEKRGTAMMFQSYALWPHMTVAANIGYGLRMRGWKRDAIAARVDEMLKLLQLEGFAPRPVTQLSGGQRQRVALGRALAVDPSLLLLDEPMSNLDYKVRLELRHELRALQQRIGITAVYVTHDREEALTLADRIAVIDAGRIVAVRHAGGGLPPARRRRSSPASWAPTTRSISRARRRHAGCRGRRNGRPRGPRAFPQRRGARSPSAAERPAADALSLPGVVAQAVYVGQGYRYRVRAGGAEVWVHAPERVAEGTAACVVVPREALMLFPARFHHSQLGGSRCESVMLVAAAAAAAFAAASPASAQTTLNVVTAGDQNMVDYVNNYLGPKFEKMNPGVKVRAVGTGPGDAGSQKIYEKLSAQQKAGVAAWDVDVAVVHQRGAATMVKENLLLPYRNDVAAGKLVLARHREERARRERRRLRAADVPQPDRVRLQPGPRQGAAEVLRRARRVGEEEPEAVRLQRRQGRHVRRRLRHGLGVGEQRPRRQAGEGPVRRRPTRRRSRSRSRASRTSTRTS